MMWARGLTFASLVVFASQPGFAQTGGADVMLLAQANDRCLAAYAVQRTKTDATDKAIYAAAVAGCKELRDRLSGAIAEQYPADQARELTTTLDAHAEPDFMSLLQRIRSDRAKQSGGR